MTGFRASCASKWQRLRTALSLSVAVALAACGGGGGSESAVDSCSEQGQQEWLASYMDDWYFWHNISPKVPPTSGIRLSAYFDSLLYQGGATFPADRWSGYSSTASFTQFFGDGQNMGFGFSVNGLEAVAQPGTVLRVRYVEPLSEAATKGLRRGDEIVSVGGTFATSMVAGNNFAPLTASSEGQSTTVVFRRSGVEQSLLLFASVHNLTPVQNASVLTSAGGRKVGYLFVKDMITQASTGLEAAFFTFRAQGVQDVVLDLRYNGGGLVSMGRDVASYISGAFGTVNGQTYARLTYNIKHQDSNSTFNFNRPAQALAMPRVFILAGQRTCSASEQVINAFRGVGVQAVVVGGTTCGKPVGFLSKANCGNTFSAVNFESVNAAGQGRYWDGLAATCSVAEDFSSTMNTAGDPLTAAALRYADTGSCPSATATAGSPAFKPSVAWPRHWMSDERTGMVAR